MMLCLFLSSAVAGAAPSGALDASVAAPTEPPTPLVFGVAKRETVTQPCKGGMRVTEDMFKRESAPLSKQDLTLFATHSPTGKVVARLVTDGEGKFSTRIAAGAYCLVVGRMDSVKVNDDPTPSCDAQFTVPTSGSVEVPVVLVSRNNCPGPWNNPGWHGPMPP